MKVYYNNNWIDVEKDNPIITQLRITIESGAYIESNAYIGSGATIGSGAYIGSRAHIKSDATIGSGAYIESGVTIGNHTAVGSGVTIESRATIEGNAYIRSNAYIRTGSYIESGAYIGRDATIEKSTVLIKIQGSRFVLYYWGENKVKIGCQIKSIDKWFEEGMELAGKEGFTESQIEEYKTHLNYIKQIHSLKENK